MVALHWLAAVLILSALMLGFFVLAAMPNTDPAKINALMIHMAVGMVILALMALRFMWFGRRKTI